MKKYPVPGAVGSLMIREVVKLLRSTGITLPITSHILISCSAGPDSMALAHLIAKYGRRVGLAGFTLLHVNHGWRGEESDADEELVREFASNLKVGFLSKRLPNGKGKKGESWENAARLGRKKVFVAEARRLSAYVLTGHHADDLAETLLWRLFTGNSRTHGAGILIKEGVELRPFLRIRKEQIFSYLKEENIPFRIDSSNADPRFLRAQMRRVLMPQMENLFPQSIQHLIDIGLAAQLPTKESSPSLLVEEPWPTLFAANGLKLRQAHWKVLSEKLRRDPNWLGELHLPQGWRLKCEKAGPRGGKMRGHRRWVLEQV